jgi:hypothetical protein
VVSKVKEECEGAAQSLVLELEKRFTKHEMMTAFGVVYP